MARGNVRECYNLAYVHPASSIYTADVSNYVYYTLFKWDIYVQFLADRKYTTGMNVCVYHRFAKHNYSCRNDKNVK
jgi:hypothetical protein